MRKKEQKRMAHRIPSLLARVTPRQWHDVCRIAKETPQTQEAMRDIARLVQLTQRHTNDAQLRKKKEVLQSMVLARPGGHALPTTVTLQSLLLSNGKRKKKDDVVEGVLTVSLGHVRATLSFVPIYELQRIVAYFLQKGLLPHPENYELFEWIEAEDSAILLHELLKEDENILRMAYQFAYRLRPQNEKKFNKYLHQTETIHYNDLTPEPVARPENDAVKHEDGPLYQAIQEDKDKIVRANYSDGNDPLVYSRVPVRCLNKDKMCDVKDPDQHIDLCSQEMSDFMERSAFAEKRFPKYNSEKADMLDDQRQLLAERRRVLCPTRQDDIRHIESTILEKNVPVDAPRPLPPSQIDYLKTTMNWPEDKLRKARFVQ
jgi:hypothetical protein